MTLGFPVFWLSVLKRSIFQKRVVGIELIRYLRFYCFHVCCFLCLLLYPVWSFLMFVLYHACFVLRLCCTMLVLFYACVVPCLFCFTLVLYHACSVLRLCCTVLVFVLRLCCTVMVFVLRLCCTALVLYFLCSVYYPDCHFTGRSTLTCWFQLLVRRGIWISPNVPISRCSH